MMKRLLVAVLAASQIAAMPAGAAELVSEGGTTLQQRGAFAGARVRLSLGGPESGKARAGLAVAPLVWNQGADGRSTTRFGEGVEIGFSSDDKLHLSLAGRPMSQLTPGGKGPDGGRSNVSTVGWVAIGVGAVVVAGALLLAWVVHEAGKCPDGTSSHGGC